MSGTDVLVKFAREVAQAAYDAAQRGSGVDVVLQGAEDHARRLAANVVRAKAERAAEEKAGPPAAPPDVPWSTAPSDTD